MAGGLDFAAWLEEQLADAPPELVRRTRDFISRAGRDGPAGLVAAGELALARAVAGSRDRSAALDLLAADALVTLALAASVEADPAGIEEFAMRIRDRHQADGGLGPAGP